MPYKCANYTMRVLWNGELWTCDSNFRDYPPEFVSTYANMLIEQTDQVTDQVTDQAENQDQPEIDNNNDGDTEE